MPVGPTPIVIIGAGGIVREAHLPAYRIAGFPVAGIFDVRLDAAQDIARQFGIPKVFGSIEEAAAAPGPPVFDLAVPASEIFSILEKLPRGCGVLIQKPMGEDLLEAQRIRDLCNAKSLIAAVNFQLRTAPYAIAARALVESGVVGDLIEVDVKVNVNTPWGLWSFLEKAPRMEIVYHSIHYIDFARSLLGEPQRVYARTIKHPASQRLHSSRSAILLDYGDWKRATIVTNHGHDFGAREQESYVKLEGPDGAVKFQMGLNLNYPDGGPDYLRYVRRGDPEWTEVRLEGSWFPHAFIGTMASVQRAVEGSSEFLPTSVDDAFKTMAVVEAAYRSSEHGGELVPE